MQVVGFDEIDYELSIWRDDDPGFSSIPMGVYQDETIEPNGGGMWRKNRRFNSPGVYGVDPNRNYPYEWVGNGSSTDPSSDTYRGPSPGSEPEVIALMNLVNSHEFVTHQTLHTSGNITIHPWGYSENPSPDHDVFQNMMGYGLFTGGLGRSDGYHGKGSGCCPGKGCNRCQRDA